MPGNNDQLEFHQNQQYSLAEKRSAVSQSDQDDDSNGVKYTGRFDIQIENEKDFQVARRLIGSKGCNMKRIIEVCSKNAPRGIQNDIVKLRLRGKGSGFKEGPRQEESKEPIHLCISSKFYDKY